MEKLATNTANKREKKEMSADEIIMALLEQGVVPELNWLNLKENKPTLTGIETENGKMYYVLRFSIGNYAEIFHYYDKSTLLKTKTVKVINNNGESMTSVAEYSDFKAINGINFPHQSMVNLGPISFSISVDSIIINGAVDLKDFTE